MSAEAEKGSCEHWYQDRSKGLFVVLMGFPGETHVIGPDADTRSRLQRVYRGCEVMGTRFEVVHTEGVARALELEFVTPARRVEANLEGCSELSVRRA